MTAELRDRRNDSTVMPGRPRPDERGAVLLVSIMVVSMLMTLGMLSLTLGTQEIQSASAAVKEAAARHLAESGADLVMQWFHAPGSVPAGELATLLLKQHDSPEIGPSFFDGTGRSQFTGTADQPDVLFDASRPDDDRMLNDPTSGWFGGLGNLGRVLKLRVYGPMRPGLLCAVDVTAERDGISKTVSVELGTLHIPPLRAAVQVGTSGLTRSRDVPGEPFPVWGHWGDLKIKGDVWLGESQAIPAKTSLAQVTGASYADLSRPEDRWLDIWVGGDALLTSTSASTSQVVPSNIYAEQDPIPGLSVDRWDYDAIKEAAMRFGSYYVPGRDGLLYKNGVMQAGAGLSPDEVFQSDIVGDHRGLVFIDTIDQQPPKPGNLGTVLLKTDYAEGLFVVNAHVSWRPGAPGKSVPALSPPPEEISSLGARIPARLSNVNLKGVLYVIGDLEFEGTPRAYGALVAGGRIVDATARDTRLEVWYNHDLRSGLSRGMPLVYLAPGTWRQSP